MFYVSEVMRNPPETFRTPLEEKVYRTFEKLGMEYERVDTDPGITMEDCLNIDKVLQDRIVKTIFLCNRQQTKFYIYALPADKQFITKDFGHALGIPRVSFADAEHLRNIAGVEHGATTVLSACLESAAEVTFVFDREVVSNEYFSCTDGTATCFVKLKTSDLLDKFMKESGRKVKII